MEYSKMKTITGLSIDDLRKKLDEPLPETAYGQLPGAARLTEIDAGHMKHCLNTVFGLCGTGWGYSYDPGSIEMWDINEGNKFNWHGALIKDGTFWYVLVDNEGKRNEFTVHATGGSENQRFEYALKGSVTNMIGHAVSQLGFQESVYMGNRSFETVQPSEPWNKPADSTTGQQAAETKQVQRAASVPAADKTTRQMPTPATSLPTKARVQEAPPVAQASSQPPSEFVIPNTANVSPKHVGKILAAISVDALSYYAGKQPAAGHYFSPVGFVEQNLKSKCIAELAQRNR